MASKRITHKGIERLRSRPDRYEVWDSTFPGFGIRVTPAGAKSFVLLYRFAGKPRRATVGRFVADDPHCLSEARKRARTIVDNAKAGIDPDLVEQEKKAERARAQENTFAAVRSRFVELYARPKNRSWKDTERYFVRDVGHWDDRPIASITRRDVITAITVKAAKGGPHAAVMLRAHLSTLFKWAVGQDIIKDSPVASVLRPAATEERERVLTEVEIKRLWSSWSDDGVGWPFAPIFKFLLVTAQRRGEVAGAKWSEIDLDKAVWTIPGSRTKNGKSHEVPLAPMAVEILTSVPRFAGSEFVFPGRIRGHANGFSRAKERSDELSGVSDWRTHDLRRTAGTGMAAAGVAVSTVSKVLNHSEGGVTKIYARYSFGPEKRHALETWARVLARIVSPTAPDVADIAAAREKLRAGKR